MIGRPVQNLTGQESYLWTSQIPGSVPSDFGTPFGVCPRRRLCNNLDHTVLFVMRTSYFTAK